MKKIYSRHFIDECSTAMKHTITAMLGWLFGFPFSLILKRDPGLTVFVSRPGRFFADNGKYFFIYSTQSVHDGERVVFITTDDYIKKLIIEAGGESVRHPTFQSFYLLIRCGKFITDWRMLPGIYPLTKGAKLVQVWHGAPLKHIELDQHQKRLSGMARFSRLLLTIQKKIIGRYPVYDIVAVTSHKFITSAFSSCFKSKRFVVSGYPRNDILFGWHDLKSMAYRLTLINIDKQAFEAVNNARSRGSKICLYAPTFRKGLENPFASQIDLLRLSKFAQRNNLLIILKLHPVMHGRYHFNHYPGLIEYGPLKDVYPLLPLCDFLITDYSSIYFDFLLFDRPVLFFPYDLDEYLAQDRAMYFDYDAITPGFKCRDFLQLESKIEDIIARGCDDGYAEMREKILSFTHEYLDNQASQRLYTLI